MHVTTADLWDLAPGRVLTWHAEVSGPAPGSGEVVPLSVNQRHHLAAAAGGEPSVWLAGAFEVDGPVDAEALGGAVADLLARHDTLQTAAAVVDGAPVGRRVDPARVGWRCREVAHPATVEETRALVQAVLDAGCAPLTYPAFTPVAVSRPGRSTIVLGLDHLHADACSVAVVVDELHERYVARRDGRPPAPARPAARFTEVAAHGTPPVPDDDPRLAAWLAFLERRGNRLPTFPLPLGLPPGERLPQATRVGPLLDREDTAVLRAAAVGRGVSPFALALAAFAGAVGDLGGPAELPLLLPVSTRRTEAERHALGWFTATVPLEVRAGDDPVAVGRDLRAAVGLAAVPLEQVLAALPAPLVRERADVFMVSWLDYTRLPGAAEARVRNAHHVSAPTLADDVQLWLSATPDGVALRARYPDVPLAHSTVAELTGAWRSRLRSGPAGRVSPRRTAP
ncbi:condensation domain-containing protein [Nocardioides marmotae]|uniref:condensation domain-containing protein n=1 Tax=Nocardioides marmotae TaxID=2663857 RepID=UPI0012B53FC0|nr:condensation domain-containing protein [Nocardioides marmotae]MBC9731658.1 peptide synthase [Nocardioides marmotae]MTB82780.1 peptide synthase [Nocardioides marmotae]